MTRQTSEEHISETTYDLSSNQTFDENHTQNTDAADRLEYVETPFPTINQMTFPKKLQDENSTQIINTQDNPYF